MKSIACLGKTGAGKSNADERAVRAPLQPDESTISIDDVEHAHESPKEAIAAGIGIVHQHFMLVEVFTVAENLILGQEDSKAGLLNMGEARHTVQQLSERYGLDIDPEALVEDLPVGVQLAVEILKARQTMPGT